MSDSEDEEYSFPPHKKYVVLEMVSDDKVYSTPAVAKWLFNKKLVEREGKTLKMAHCYWPDDEKRLGDALLKCSNPKDNWIVKKDCRVLCSTQSLKSARDSADAAAIASSISESANETSPLPVKRKRTFPARFSPSHLGNREETLSDESSVETPDTFQASDLKITEYFQSQKKAKLDPPNAHELKKDLQVGQPTAVKPSSSTVNPGTSDAMTGSVNINRMDEGNKGNETIMAGGNEHSAGDGSSTAAPPHTSFAADTLSTPPCASGPRTPTPKAHSGTRGLQSSSYRFRVSPAKNLRFFSGFSSPTKTMSGDHPVSQRKFDAEVGKLHKKIDANNSILKKVYRNTCPIVELTAGDEEEDESPVLPVNNEAELNKFEQHIKIENNKVKAIRHLVTYCRSTMNDSIKAVMPRVLTDSLAMTYNMEGINRSNSSSEKKAFKGTPAYMVVLAALKTRSTEAKKGGIDHGYDVGIINTFMGAWLKNAPTRFKNSLNKGNKRKTTEPDTGEKDGSQGNPESGGSDQAGQRTEPMGRRNIRPIRGLDQDKDYLQDFDIDDPDN